MSAVHNRIIKILNRQPEDLSYKEILKELVDSQIGRT